MQMPLLDPTSADVVRRHLLILPADVAPDEVETLAMSRFPRAHWEVAPAAAAPRAGGRGMRGGPTAGVLRLSRHSSLHGPYAISDTAGSLLGLPPAAGLAYVANAPVERGPEPWPVGGDRDGLRRAFPGGLPIRDEERTVTWLVAAARRLGGGVRIAPSRAGADAVVLIPDPGAAVDLTVWTDIWLEPDAALSVMRQAVPRAYLNMPGGRWSGPPPGTGTHAARGAEVLSPELRQALHSRADDHDMATLIDPPPMTAYGTLADLELDGMLALEVSGETTLPPVIAVVPWAIHGAVAYRVKWEPADLHERESERPSLQHRVERGRAVPLVIAVTRAVHRAVGGEVTDMMDFIVDPADL